MNRNGFFVLHTTFVEELFLCHIKNEMLWNFSAIALSPNYTPIFSSTSPILWYLPKNTLMGCFFEGKDDTVLTEIITFLVGIIVDYSGGREKKKCNSRLFFYFSSFLFESSTFDTFYFSQTLIY